MHGLGCVGLGRVEFLKFWMGRVGLGYGVQVVVRRLSMTVCGYLLVRSVSFYSGVFHVEYFS